MHLHYLHLHHFPSLPFFLTVRLVWVIAFIFPRVMCMSHRTPFSPRMLTSVSLVPLHPFNIPYCWAAFLYIFPPLYDFESNKLCSLFELLLILWSLFNWLPLHAVCNFFLCRRYECFLSLQSDDVIYIFGFSMGVMENSGYFQSCKTNVFFCLMKAKMCDEDLKKAIHNMEKMSTFSWSAFWDIKESLQLGSIDRQVCPCVLWTPLILMKHHETLWACETMRSILGGACVQSQMWFLFSRQCPSFAPPPLGGLHSSQLTSFLKSSNAKAL